MSEQTKFITQEVIYICEPLDFSKKEETGFFDSIQKNVGEIADKVMPKSTAGKVAVGGLAAAAAFVAIPGGILGALAAGGIAAGVAGANALTGKDNKKTTENLPVENAEQCQATKLSIPQMLSLAKKQFRSDKKVNLDDIAIVPSDIAKNIFESDGTILKNIKRLSSGMILIRHPFLPNTYIPIDVTENELFHKKQLCISPIMQYLGAKSVSGHAKIVETKHRVIDGKGNVGYESTKVNASVMSEQNQHYESEYRVEDTFPEEYSPDDYALAIEEASKYGLDKDDDIKSLIEQRNPAKPRPIKSRRVSIEMSRELNSALDTAISLEAVGVELTGNYKSILESSKRILFELEVNF